MKLTDILPLMTSLDRIRILEDGREHYVGYLGNLQYHNKEHLADYEVVKLRCHLDIKHKQWKEKGLLAPLEPEETPDYSFSDLQTTLYYDIHIQKGGE